MSEEFSTVTNWAAVVGIWDFSSGSPVFRAPDELVADGNREARQVIFPYGICVSNVRFSEGTARTTIRCPKVDSNTLDVDGRLLFGYRSPVDPYLTVGLGGHGHAYTIYQFDPILGWRGVAFAGSNRNLIPDHSYEVSVSVRGQRVSLEVDSVQVLGHVLDAPLPQGQLGLFAWGKTSVEFADTSVSRERGTVFVVMQFSDPYHDCIQT